MTEYKIDEEELDLAVKRTKNLIASLQDIVKILEDKNKDIFERYTAYFSSRTVWDATKFATKLDQNSRVAGHDLHSELLQSEKAKEQGWDKFAIDSNPFFISTSEEENKDIKNSQLREFLRPFTESDSEQQEH